MDKTQYLYAISCRELINEIEVGFCFVDTQIGTFYIGQFINDRHLSSLRTLLSHNPPAQVLYEKNRLPQSVLALLQLYPGVVFDPLIHGKEFWEASNTLKYLSESNYLGASCQEWPSSIKSFLSPNSSLGNAYFCLISTPHRRMNRGLGGSAPPLFLYLSVSCLLSHANIFKNRALNFESF